MADKTDRVVLAVLDNGQIVFTAPVTVGFIRTIREALEREENRTLLASSVGEEIDGNNYGKQPTEGRRDG